MSGKQPDFRLAVSPRYSGQGDRPRSTRIGAAWKIVKDGAVIGVNIKLDEGLPPIVLSNRFDLTLWKNEPNKDSKAPEAAPPEDDFGDDDIPF